MTFGILLILWAISGIPGGVFLYKTWVWDYRWDMAFGETIGSEPELGNALMVSCFFGPASFLFFMDIADYLRTKKAVKAAEPLAIKKIGG